MNSFFDWPGHRWLGLAARWYLAAVFIYASLHKIAHPGAFALDVASYEILPLWLVNITAITMPWVEIAAGALLLLGLRARAAALVCTGLMVIFMIALASALARGLDLSCGCFASQSLVKSDPISYLTMLRDLGWLAVALYVVVFDRRPLGVEALWRAKKA
jgi:putative oxidoreductase